MKHYHRFLGPIVFFAVIGFFASLLSFLSWFLAPILGWRIRSYFPQKKIIFVSSLGLFLGGLPMGLVCSTGAGYWLMGLLLTTAVPLLFLLGVLTRYITLAFGRRTIIIGVC